MKTVVHKFDSFKEAEEADLRFYRSLSGQQRLNLLLELIQQGNPKTDETAKGFKRVYRIVKLSES